MKLEYDIRFFNPEIHNDVSSSKENSLRDMSIAPFININEDNKPNKKSLEKEELAKKLKKLTDIVNEDKMRKFMVQCLVVDFGTILIFTFEFIDAFMEIGGFIPSILCLLRYIFSMINGIYCLDFLIVQNEFQNNRKQMEFEMLNKKEYKIPPPTDSNQFVYLNPPNAILRKIYFNKFWMWFFKYVFYLIFMFTQNKVDMINYVSLFFMMIEHYQYNMCKFYYFTTLRCEFNKAKIDRLDSLH